MATDLLTPQDEAFIAKLAAFVPAPSDIESLGSHAPVLVEKVRNDIRAAATVALSVSRAYRPFVVDGTTTTDAVRAAVWEGIDNSGSNESSDYISDAVTAGAWPADASSEGLMTNYMGAVERAIAHGLSS